MIAISRSVQQILVNRKSYLIGRNWIRLQTWYCYFQLLFAGDNEPKTYLYNVQYMSLNISIYTLLSIRLVFDKNLSVILSEFMIFVFVPFLNCKTSLTINRNFSNRPAIVLSFSAQSFHLRNNFGKFLYDDRSRWGQRNIGCQQLQ